MIVKLCAHTHI